MKKKFKFQKRQALIALAATVLFLGTITYAYFTNLANNDKNQLGALSTGTMSLRFADNDNGINAEMTFGESITKKFIIENTGSLESSLSLDFNQLINTYLKGSLSYRMEYSDTQDGTYIPLIQETDMPISTEPLSQTVASEISVPAGETRYYNLIITLNNLKDVNQESDLKAKFNTKFNVGEPVKYRRYKLTVDMNGGEWETFTAPQEYLLMNNETKTISDPTRIGYTFNGWTIKGIGSEMEKNVYSMGISNASLVANWTPNEYTITIDANGGTYEGNTTIKMHYGETTTIPEPTRENHTFIGWDKTGGTYEGTTFTLSDAKDVKLTAQWRINNYKYIVYHYQMNLDGNGYTLVDGDTDEGKATINSVVRPEVKTYKGFKSPERQSLTIKSETANPPVLNKIDYNYDRNQYNLTINTDGGTYEETLPSMMYYGATITLPVPTKIGYNFTNWTTTSGSLNDNQFTIEDSEATLTAKYSPKEYNIEFNANGGSLDTLSKTVTYDSTYGELPEPTYKSFTFIGWFTEKVDGEQIDSDTAVTISENQTLYAHWKENSTLIAYTDKTKIWTHREAIKNIVFEPTMSPKENATYTYDLSSDDSGTIMSYLIPDETDSTLYTLYIQSNGKINANENSSNYFAGFIKLETIEGLQYLDTSNVTNMSNFFGTISVFLSSKPNSSLKSLDLSNFDTSNVTNMKNMFNGCQNLISLDLSSFDTSNVTDMSYMFKHCYALTSLNVSNFNTSNVTNMSTMFAGCKTLKTLDLSSFNTSNVTNMSSLFGGILMENCTSLETVNLSSFDTSNVTNMNYMFYNCTSLKTLDLSNFDTSNVTGMMDMFNGCKSLKTLDLSSFNTNIVTNMSSMFNNCNALTSLNVSNFNTSNATSMMYMFNNCNALTSLNLSSFDTSNVTSMMNMFNNCNALTSLNLSNFNTSNVTSMFAMFNGCKSLKTLDLSNFDTSNVTSMYSMFNNCINLETVNLSSFNTSKVTDMTAMFKNCSSLTSLNVSNFDTSKVTEVGGESDSSTSTYGMFEGCSNLQTLNLSNFNISSIKESSHVFDNILPSIIITINNTNIKQWILDNSTLTDSNINIV